MRIYKKNLENFAVNCASADRMPLWFCSNPSYKHCSICQKTNKTKRQNIQTINVKPKTTYTQPTYTQPSIQTLKEEDEEDTPFYKSTIFIVSMVFLLLLIIGLIIYFTVIKSNKKTYAEDYDF